MTTNPSTEEGIDATTLSMLSKQYLGLRDGAKALVARQEKLKKRLKAYVQANGVQDGENQFTAVEGVAGLKGLQVRNITNLVRNDDRLIDTLTDHDLYKPVSEGGVLRYVPVVDEDELERRRAEGKISLSAIEACYDEKVQHQLWVVEE